MQKKTNTTTKSPTLFQDQKNEVNSTNKETTTVHNDHEGTTCNNYNPLLWAWNGLKKVHQILSSNCTDTYDPVNFPPVP